MADIEIKNVTIKIGKKELELTMEEAKKLKESLEELFQKEVIVERQIEREVIRDHNYPPFRWYTNPSTIPMTPKFICEVDDTKSILCMNIK